MHTAQRLIVAAALLAASAPALAGAPDLVTTIDAPVGEYVYATSRYTVEVDNVGNKHAYDVSLTIDLPLTTTSPTVYVMGVVGSMSGSCSQVGVQLECDLGRIRRGQSAEIFFDIELPHSTDPIVIDASASTAGESNPADNDDSVTAALLNDAIVWSKPSAQTIEHCTGTDLSSFYECELSPSSITWHPHTLNADYSITLGGGFTGTWWSDSADHLAFEYTDGPDTVVEFEGYGVSPDCWEGAAIFPGSAYMSMYKVCID
ncbi:MAG: hypothetical protein ACI8PZ_003746 [Myxococcota bacterium]|jgi:hypothetical protein